MFTTQFNVDGGSNVTPQVFDQDISLLIEAGMDEVAKANILIKENEELKAARVDQAKENRRLEGEMKEALDSAMKLTSELKRLHSENSELSAWASTEAKLRSDIGKFKNFAVELKHENERLRARVVLLTEEVGGLQEAKMSLMKEKTQMIRQQAVGKV